MQPRSTVEKHHHIIAAIQPQSPAPAGSYPSDEASDVAQFGTLIG